ncbi:MAG: NADH-quinone oxidoreductase subunit C, partial [Smithellaceae bacterium]|nr:NADH-quinone oxidoreductase subunit C [Smithellaceae bacterium]
MEKARNYIPQNAKAELYGNAVAFEVPSSELLNIVSDLHNNRHFGLKLITAADERLDQRCFKVWYLFCLPGENLFIIPYIRLKNTLEFPSLASTIHEALNYEKKIRTFFGLEPAGHPDERPVILHENWPGGVFPLRKDFACMTRPESAQGAYPYKIVKGEGIYEIPVGPIHAGIIEPGHFRFSVAGEEIMLLEARLGFTHKGCEKLFEKLSLNEKIRLSEKISGDSSFGHSLAFCQAVEQLGDIAVSKRARYLRVIYAELERLANHFGDIGAIMLDTGFNFGGSHGARLREMIMQINGRLTGSRFLRGVNVAGGVTKDLSAFDISGLSAGLAEITEDFLEVIEVAENSFSLMNRLKGTGVLSHEIAEDRGIVGIAGKAAGISGDARFDYPYAAYDELPMGNVVTARDGDVYSRFIVRVKEVSASVKIIQEALARMPEEPLSPPEAVTLKKNSLAVSCVEGWRGEILYFAATDSSGNLSRIAPRDPSFINWAVLGVAGCGNVVPDFPL